MLSLFKKRHVWDVAQEWILKKHIYSLSFRECVQQYPDHEIIKSHPNFNRNMALMASAQVGFIELVVKYTKKAKKGARYKAFLSACDKGYLPIASHLVTYGLVYSSHCKALRRACQAGHFQIVKMMLEKFPNLLHKAFRPSCYSGNVKLVRFLVEKGANYQSVLDSDCFTDAVKSKSNDLVKYLSSLNGSYESLHIILRLGTRKMVIDCLSTNIKTVMARYDIWSVRDVVYNMLFNNIPELIPYFTEDDHILSLMEIIIMGTRWDDRCYEHADETVRKNLLIKSALLFEDIAVKNVDKLIVKILRHNSLVLLKSLLEDCGTKVGSAARKEVKAIRHYLRTEETDQLPDRIRFQLTFRVTNHIENWQMTPEMLGFLLNSS